MNFEGAPAFYEDTLVGSRLRIGDVDLEVDKRNRRCVMINLEPADAVSSPRVLQRVGRGYKGYAGVYAKPLNEGLVREGDPVFLLG